jgi:hypothetical protein
VSAVTVEVEKNEARLILHALRVLDEQNGKQMEDGQISGQEYVNRFAAIEKVQMQLEGQV